MENEQFTQIMQAIKGLEERMDKKMDEKLVRLEERMDEKLISLEERMDRKMDSLEIKMISTFNLRMAEVKGELTGLREEVRSNNAQFCHLLGNLSKRVQDIEERIA